MTRLKRILKYVLVFFILVIVFRGFLYRTSVNYSQVGERKAIELTDAKLIKEIDKAIEGRILDINEVISLSNSLTSERLSFTFDQVSSNPNIVCDLEKGNCIGYSSLFNAICNYVIRKQKMTDTYQCTHLVGKLDFFGFDIHSAIDSPFFKDHDFNEIANLETGEKKFVDPSLRDYLRINYVTCNKEE